MEKVEAAVKDVFGPLNPREDVSLEHLSSLIVEVRKKVEGTTEEERRSVDLLAIALITMLIAPQEQKVAPLPPSAS